MTPKTESDVIVEYALSGPDQLELVALAGSAYDRLRATVWGRFLTALAPVVGERLGPGWVVRVNAVTDGYDEPLSALCTNRTDKLRIVLGTDERRFPKKPYLAVRATEGTRFGTMTKADVYKALNATHRRGETAESIWYWYFPSPYYRVGDVDDLKRLYEQTDWLDFFSREIGALARAMEAVFGIQTTLGEPAV